MPDQSEAISRSVSAIVGTDAIQYTTGETPPKLFGYRHSWPFDDSESKHLELTPSQFSTLVRAEFTKLLPANLTAEERHEAWHRFLVVQPSIWPACHGGLTNRVEEFVFFKDWNADEVQ